MDSKEHTTSAKMRGKRQSITVAPHEAPPGDKTPTADSASPVAKLLLTPQEAAQALGINRSTLYKLLMRGDFPSFKVGRSRKIPVKVLEDWIAQQLAA